MAIVNKDGMNTFLPWLRVPNPLTGQTGEIAIGETVTIKSEFDAPPNPKIKGFSMGTVEFNGVEWNVCLNFTSHKLIEKAYGRDTKDWIGHQIEYRGMKKTEKGGMAHIWQGFKEG